MKRIYLDYNATAPLDARVRAAMEPYWEGTLGNPSSLHAEGRRARGAIDLARDEVAAFLHARPSQIIFTSGGTESNNLAVQGLAQAQMGKGKHIITCQTEHHAVLHACRALEVRHGFEVSYLPVNEDGLVEPGDLFKALRPDTTVVSIMSANNETGVVQPIAELAQLCRTRGILFHTDAVQSVGRQEVPADHWGAAAISFTAHKLHGPLGVGVLWLEAGVPLARLQEGGAHENERRPGTENTAGIVGLAAAVRYNGTVPVAEAEREQRWIDQLWNDLEPLGGIRWNGRGGPRLQNTLNVTLSELHGEEFLIGLDLEGLAVSSGSACLVGSVQPSHVLAAMYAARSGEKDLARSATVRISIGPEIRDEEREEVGRRMKRVVDYQRSLVRKRA